MDTWLSEHINNLAAGSVVILICNEIEAQDITNEGLTIFFIDNDLKKGRYNDNHYEEILIENGDIPRSIFNWINIKIFGKIIEKRPGFHFQIDLLYIEDKMKHDIYGYLKQYVHPNGYICSKKRQNLKGDAHKKQDTWFEIYNHTPIYDIPFARLGIQEKKWIHQQVAALAPGSVYVEIGSYKGGSSVIAACSNPDVHIVCVDTWLGDEKEGVHTSKSHFNRHTQYYKNVISVQIDINHLERGPELISKALGIDLKEKGIDLLFIDADHSYKSCLNDLIIYEKYIKKGICFHHDAYFGGVKRAINAYFGYPHEKLIAKTRIGRWFITNRGYYVYGGPEDSSIWAIKISR
ncbi:MAG: class I SAM-dependent methyltransferase [Nitrospirae bacterium]|nr:class I SAM-dependent methyltransferase [Nitrospirota bacterium]MBF0541705.1 class I SAM-dependent methyltransferase [Nitrospirota bacterium]